MGHLAKKDATNKSIFVQTRQWQKKEMFQKLLNDAKRNAFVIKKSATQYTYLNSKEKIVCTLKWALIKTIFIFE